MIVKSTNIRSIDYEEDKRELTIVFTNNNKYKYLDVNNEVFVRFQDAVERDDSVGRLFNTLVKGKYNYVKIEEKKDVEDKQ